MRIFILLLLAVSISFPSCGRIRAQESPQVKPKALIVAVDKFPPFSDQLQDGQIVGHDIDLWEKIARLNQWDFEFRMYPTVNDILKAVESGDADVGISGITINHERSKQIDFSQPYFESEIGILVPCHQTAQSFFSQKLPAIWAVLKGALQILFVILSVFALSMWVIERRNGDEANFSKSPLQGIGQAYWWAIVTATTVGYGDITPKKASGRILAAIVMVAGIMWFGSFTASMSSALTLLTQEANATSIEDLRGKKVGVKSGSTSSALVQKIRWGYDLDVDTYSASKIDVVCDNLSNGIIAGFVFDKPALERMSRLRDDVVVSKVKIGGERYGIVVPLGSPLRKVISQEILFLESTGELENLRKKWLGDQ
jgi:ABC-type amino acid transport substrate-binding protein